MVLQAVERVRIARVDDRETEHVHAPLEHVEQQVAGREVVRRRRLVDRRIAHRRNVRGTGGRGNGAAAACTGAAAAVALRRLLLLRLPFRACRRRRSLIWRLWRSDPSTGHDEHAMMTHVSDFCREQREEIEEQHVDIGRRRFVLGIVRVGDERVQAGYGTAESASGGYDHAA